MSVCHQRNRFSTCHQKCFLYFKNYSSDMVKQLYICNHLYLNICTSKNSSLLVNSSCLIPNINNYIIHSHNSPTSAISSMKGSPRSAGGPLHRDSVIRYPSIPVTSSRQCRSSSNTWMGIPEDKQVIRRSFFGLDILWKRHTNIIWLLISTASVISCRN